MGEDHMTRADPAEAATRCAARPALGPKANSAAAGWSRGALNSKRGPLGGLGGEATCGPPAAGADDLFVAGARRPAFAVRLFRG
jgi:hypothetical protein